jgi:hypothetical protein
MNRLYNFSQYSRYKAINEDGYGKEDFFFAKDGKSFFYYFKIHTEGELQGYYIRINKTSDYLNISDAENSYCVCSLYKVDPDELDDFLVREMKSPLESISDFNITEETLSKIWKIFLEVTEDYLDKNPKVNHVYDEFTKSFTNDIGYKNIVESIMAEDDAPRWSIQETSEKGVYLYTKKDHK